MNVELPSCPHCRRAPCRCDHDAGDVRVDHDVDDEIDVYAELCARERADRAAHWLRPYRPEER